MFETKVSSDKNIGGFASFEDIKNNGVKVDFEKDNGNVGGVVMFSDGKTGYVFDDDGFYAVIGGTASKKTRDVVLPFVLSNSLAGNSMVISDVKGDIYKNSSKKLKDLGYKIVVLNFNCPQNSDAYNPFRQMYRDYHNGNSYRAKIDLNAFSEMIFNFLKAEKDPYWHIASANYFTGCMLTLWEHFDEDQATIANIYNLHFQGEKKFSPGTVSYMHKYYEDKTSSETWKKLCGFVEAPTDTRASLYSVFTSALNNMACQSEGLAGMMSDSTFEVRDLVEQKTAIFIIANEQALSVHGPLISSYISQWYDILVELAEINNGELKRKVVFALDEFGNLPAIRDFEKKISLSRARGISWMIVLQSVAQLRLRYGKEVADTIISNTTNWIYLYSSDPEFRTYISNLCGEIYDPTTGRIRNIITANQLRNFTKLTEDGLTECLLLLGRMKPCISFLPDITEYAGIEPIEALDIPERKYSFAKPIDFCKIVEDAEKEKKLAEMRKRENARKAVTESKEKIKEDKLQDEEKKAAHKLDKIVDLLVGGA